MDSIVLVKAVPRTEDVRYDPALGRMVREGSPLVLNPFDQRALRVALELRRPGESVTAISLGPPGTLPLLREARALGVDRAVLLSDPAFAGSDTLVTARALVRAVSGAPHDLVLAGSRSTDSDTGQVPAEVAELLGLPLLSDARSVRRDPVGTGLEVTVDTAVGWESYRASLPLVITVGEKIAKPLRVAPEAVAALPEASVERYDLDRLGLPPTEVGQAGSPTRVGRLAPNPVHRVPEILREGPVEERVRRAVVALERRLPALRPPAAGLPPAPEDRSVQAEVLVLVSGTAGELSSAGLGLVSEVRRSLPGHWPSAVWVGESPSAEVTESVAAAGALAGYAVPGGCPPVSPRALAAVFEAIWAERTGVAAIIAPSSAFGREALGRLAARRALGLVGDATGIAVDSEGELLWSKPAFAGAAIAEIRTITRPALATVPAGLFSPASGPSAGVSAFPWQSLRVPELPSDFAFTGQAVEGTDPAELERLDVLVAVGMGIGGPEGVERLRPTLTRWKAGLVATRRVVDAGWVPRSLQLGITGRSLAPRLAVLLGVSGSVNHMVGWSRAAAILAVNRDEAAPVFRSVDVGVVADLEEALPILTEELSARLRV